jgi:hypothetical protein
MPNPAIEKESTIDTMAQVQGDVSMPGASPSEVPVGGQHIAAQQVSFVECNKPRKSYPGVYYSMLRGTISFF